MTAGAPIGKRIRQICMILTDYGSQGIRDIHTHIPEMAMTNISKCCAMGVKFGLLTVHYGNNTLQDHNIYTVRHDWQDMIDNKSRLKLKRSDGYTNQWAGVNSVFQIGDS